MKKVKIMLAAVAVFGVVGGALAFKAKKGNLDFCVLSTSQAKGGFCTARFLASQNGGNQYYYTRTIVTNCAAVTCNGQAIALQDQ